MATISHVVRKHFVEFTGFLSPFLQAPGWLCCSLSCLHLLVCTPLQNVYSLTRTTYTTDPTGHTPLLCNC